MVGRRDARRPSRTTIIVLVLLSITLLTLDFRGDGGALSGVRDVALDVLSPVRSAVEWATAPVSDAWNGAFGYDELETENAELRRRVEELEAEMLLLAEERRRFEELDALDDAVGGLGIPSIEAQVIDAPISDFEQTVELDVGTGDGVAVDMPVVGPGGLVGRVVQVTGSRARAQLLTDANFGVGVRLSRSGETGVAQGRGRTEPLLVELLEPDTPVIPGETVTTSGLAGLAFPPGLLVGTVSGAELDPLDDTLEVEVVPAADLNRLDTVAVLVWTPEVLAEPATTTTAPPPTDAPDVTDPDASGADATDADTGADVTGADDTGVDGATSTSEPVPAATPAPSTSTTGGGDAEDGTG